MCMKVWNSQIWVKQGISSFIKIFWVIEWLPMGRRKKVNGAICVTIMATEWSTTLIQRSHVSYNAYFLNIARWVSLRLIERRKKKESWSDSKFPTIIISRKIKYEIWIVRGKFALVTLHGMRSEIDGSLEMRSAINMSCSNRFLLLPKNK